MRRIVAIFLTLALILSLCACGEGDPAVPHLDPAIEPPVNDPEGQKTFIASRLEQDYVYMWHDSGLPNSSSIAPNNDWVNLQSPYYMARLSRTKGTIKGLNVYRSSIENTYAVADFSKLGKGETGYKITYNGNVFTGTNENQMRWIDSGRNINTIDYCGFTFGNDFRGRVEYVAGLYHLAIYMQVFSDADREVDASMEFAIDPQYTVYYDDADKRSVRFLDDDQNGFVFLLPREETSTQIICRQNVIEIKKEAMETASDHRSDNKNKIGFIAIPVIQGDLSLYEEFLAMEELQLSAMASTPYKIDRLPVCYDSYRGVWVVDISENSVPPTFSSATLNDYERVKFDLKNPSDQDIRANVEFFKDAGKLRAVTGVSPMIRDGKTLEPIGRQVQLSKNFHQPITDKTSLYNKIQSIHTGSWLHSYANLPVKRQSEDAYEYTCAYGNWGDTLSASHAQLCLAGWGNSEQLWDQAAVGSWGENICYEPDSVQNSAFIQDVRPTMMKGDSGYYAWTANVGGATFLFYHNENDELVMTKENMTTYYTQAPNMPTVMYTGVTRDDKISQEITVRLIRTNDVVRNYFHLKYYFNEDTQFNRLSFFKVASDGYSLGNSFQKYACGDQASIYEEDQNASVCVPNNAYLTNKKNLKAADDDFWFMLYDANGYDPALNCPVNSSLYYCVREFQANINGKMYGRPEYSLFGIRGLNNGKMQVGCEISPPEEANGKIEAGSTVEMTIEFCTLPDNAEDYYGESEYLNSLQTEIMGNAQSGYLQTTAGIVEAKVSRGRLRSIYPLVISAAETAQGCVARFSVTGGLGYIPIEIKGLATYGGYTLQRRLSDGSWQDIDQSVNGKDFWQAYYNAYSGKYQLTYTVENTKGTDFNIENEYRLMIA